MDLYYKQEVTVGVLVIVALTIFVVGVAWLSGTPLLGSAGLTTVSAEFSDVTGLSAGDPVRVSGFRVGRVSDMRLEGLGRVRVDLEVPSEYRPHADATARIASIDFLGSKAVDYEPGTSSTMLDEDRVIVGSSEAGLLEGSAGLTEQLASVLTGLQGILTEETTNQLRATMDAAERALLTIEDAADGPVMRDARAAIASMGQVAERLDTLLANPALGRSVDRIDGVTANLDSLTGDMAEISETLGSILAKVDSAQGTLGLAVNDSTVYYNIDEVLRSMKELLDDMRERPSRYFRLTVF